MPSLKHLRKLSIVSLRLGVAGAEALSKGISRLSLLEELDLSDNQIADGIVFITASLFSAKLYGIKSLTLSDNNLGCYEMSMIRLLLSEITASLTALDLSSNYLLDRDCFETLSSCFLKKSDHCSQPVTIIATALQRLNVSHQRSDSDYNSTSEPLETFPLSHFHPLCCDGNLSSLSLHGWNLDDIALLGLRCARSSGGSVGGDQSGAARGVYEDLDIHLVETSVNEQGTLTRSVVCSARKCVFLPGLAVALLRPQSCPLLTLHLNGIQLGAAGYAMLLKSLEEEERLCVQHSDVDTGRCSSSSSTSPSSSCTAVGYSLKELNLSNTCIDKRCAKVVAEIIQRFSFLEELILTDNKFGCVGAFDILQAAKSLERLELVDMRGSVEVAVNDFMSHLVFYNGPSSLRDALDP
ncbi:hypothetical protein GUITHDRAFT_105061 [Guillardia theta CCMP2712]|uniref:Uncharacterized protein n=1 Tax=Guillardia theta (strain CCMP2712) TaxID=905079 RepID=L1JKD1_GUITC|nr:hypothetical protein GUITHDRAFT_105061 [Guillardia theta CCMP2712]EKX48978.1 hypothetical protein GUITHDRAFT_105061 [Guillardia theta CCMP2712]|eukprot:XP_005835958.1 hypothetical protein GUITHDRAFT_105061 [Guillardia theta CCMP2712]